MTTFAEARQFLLDHREDYAKAYAGFRWPDPVPFNWALDWFDQLAATPAIADRPALWIVDKEYPGGHHEPGWVGVGFIVTEPGALLVIVMVILAWLARSPKSRGAVAVPWLASILLVGLAVAWFAMSAKPGS